MQKKIPVEFGTNVVGYFGFLFFPWLLTILVGKHYGVEVLGEVSLALSIATPIFIFFSLQIRNRVASDMHLRPDKKSFLRWRISLSLMAFIPPIIITLVFYPSEIQLSILLLICSWRFIESLSDMVYGFLQRGNHLGYIGTSQIFKYVPASLILLILSLNGSKLSLVLLISIFPLYLFFLIFDIRNYFSLKFPESDISNTREFFVASIPLGISASVSALIVNIPRYFLGYQFGKSEVGHFTASFVIYSLCLMGINFLLQLYLGKLKERYEKDPKSYTQFSFVILLGCLLLSGAFFLVSRYFAADILGFLYGDEFLSYQKFLVCFGYLAFLSYPINALSYLLLAKQNIKIQFPASVISLFATVLGLYIFRSQAEYSVFWALGTGHLTQLSIYLWSLIKQHGKH